MFVPFAPALSRPPSLTRTTGSVITILQYNEVYGAQDLTHFSEDFETFLTISLVYSGWFTRTAISAWEIIPSTLLTWSTMMMQ